MKLKSVHIRNFRGIGQLDVPIGLSDLSIFIGDNGTCKTSILEAINYCLSPGYIASRLDINDFHNGTADEFEITLEFADVFVAKLADGFATQDVICNKVRLLAKKREKAAPGKAFSDLVTTMHYVVPVADRGEKGWSQPRRSAGGSEFKFTERQLSFPSVDADLPRAFYFPKNRSRQLERGYNSSFQNIVDDLNWRFEKGQRDKEDAAHFKHDRKALHEKVIAETEGDTLKKTLVAANAILKELDLERVGISVLKTLSPYDHSEVVIPLDGFELPVESAGSGVEMAVALALLEAMALISKQKIVVIIDEPELHLHPKLQARLFEHLKRAAQDVQIVASTHSPILFKNVFDYPNSKLQLTKRNGPQLVVEDAHALGFGHLSWSPSWGEICYLAYDLPTVEFHDELYCAIEEGLKPTPGDRVSQNDVEQWLLGQGQTKEIKWVDASGRPQEETLMTFVRNRIHHPDNRSRPEYSSEQLRGSIARMAKLIKP